MRQNTEESKHQERSPLVCLCSDFFTLCKETAFPSHLGKGLSPWGLHCWRCLSAGEKCTSMGCPTGKGPGRGPEPVPTSSAGGPMRVHVREPAICGNHTTRGALVSLGSSDAHPTGQSRGHVPITPLSCSSPPFSLPKGLSDLPRTSWLLAVTCSVRFASRCSSRLPRRELCSHLHSSSATPALGCCGSLLGSAAARPLALLS